ncbi:DUF4340 domain-containing protein [Saccharospirillum sp. HFRX-1]|uniref:DUF4340 domain-containing protein n=1 Tax=unclassified Saccharospirillum TaxID=2633430 RepID=UPI003714FEA4
MLNKINRWLLVALAAQLLLIVALLSGRWLGHSGPSAEPLLSLSSTQVTELQLVDQRDDEPSQLTLTQADNGWQFDVDGRTLPASPSLVEALLTLLSDTELNWPVASSGGAAERFATDADHFRQQLTLVTAEGEQQFYFGTSPSYQQLYVRRDGDDAVYSIDLDASQLSADAQHWLDNRLLQVDPQALSEAQVDDIQLLQQDGQWQPQNTQTEFSLSAWQDWLQRWQSLIVSRLIAAEDASAFTADGPVLTVDFGEAGRYQLFQEGDRYALSSSRYPGLFGLSNGTGSALANTAPLWQSEAEEDSVTSP